ncbi:hypothetical protein Tdes44962_MAKER04895 [Teratosphaeria destructans]|uniref:Uncharacterized protein n=1 Tax=Teratosphaeria destructans TaxID=418781 RepID=A0A9W7SLE5_9PEZI|nr:hypothetical protein Tdes44962_MAKER04895 [Teratosphaeria destructans]
MGSWISTFNRLLPFATPGTPLIQDLAHLAAICGLLYYAPQIQQWYHRRIELPLDQHQGIEVLQDEPIDHAPAQFDDTEIEDEDDDEPIDAFDDRGPPQAGDAQAQEAEHRPIIDNEGDAGPAQPGARARRTDIGAKKAKSLARRDQRRAYHEFQRSQGEAQRARDAAGAAEREAAQAAERERRRATEAALEAKKAKEREQKREQERKEYEEGIRRRDLAVRLVREALEESRLCDLFKVAKQVGGDVDEEWVEKIIRASGLLGTKGDVMTLITGMGWAVRVSAEDMAKVYEDALGRAGEDGRIHFDMVGKELEARLGEVAIGAS